MTSGSVTTVSDGAAGPIIAIVGRPNVGKSTLFNRIVGERRALVEDSPGVTRDRHYGAYEWNGRRAMVVDTGGFDTSDDKMAAGIRRQIDVALAEAGGIIFVVNAIDGLIGADLEAWERLRRASVPIVVAANKVDHGSHEVFLGELERLGAKTVVPISALHGRGVGELLDIIGDLVKGVPLQGIGELSSDASEEPAGDGEVATSKRRGRPPVEREHPRVAVLGRPNVGKSTLINRLLGEERYITSDVPGTTRDAIDTRVDHGTRAYTLIDTAGIRRRAQIYEKVEHFSVAHAMRAIDRADVCVLVFDASEPPSMQDARLAGIIRDKGRALVAVLNKWDLAVEKKISKRAAAAELGRCLHFLSDVPHLAVTATTGSGLDRLLPLIDEVFKQYTTRVPTPELNRIMEAIVNEKPPPTVRGRLMKVLYISQPRTAPPTFLISTNTKDEVPENYRRYVENRLRDALGLRGSPVRLHFRKRE